MPSTAISTAVEPTERQHLQQQPTDQSFDRLPQVWAQAAAQFGDTIVAFWDLHAEPELSLTWRQLWNLVQQFAGGGTSPRS